MSSFYSVWILGLPPLSDSVELRAYANKLYDNASFVIASEEGEFVGFAAFYCNKALKQLYVPLICVAPSSQGRGIGGLMLSSMEKQSLKDFYTIGLEVRKSNVQALHFYKKHGFIEKENRDEKFLMEKTI